MKWTGISGLGNFAVSLFCILCSPYVFVVVAVARKLSSRPGFYIFFYVHFSCAKPQTQTIIDDFQTYFDLCRWTEHEMEFIANWHMCATTMPTTAVITTANLIMEKTSHIFVRNKCIFLFGFLFLFFSCLVPFHPLSSSPCHFIEAPPHRRLYCIHVGKVLTIFSVWLPQRTSTIVVHLFDCLLLFLTRRTYWPFICCCCWMAAVKNWAAIVHCEPKLECIMMKSNTIKLISPSSSSSSLSFFSFLSPFNCIISIHFVLRWYKVIGFYEWFAYSLLVPVQRRMATVHPRACVCCHCHSTQCNATFFFAFIFALLLQLLVVYLAWMCVRSPWRHVFNFLSLSMLLYACKRAVVAFRFIHFSPSHTKLVS